MTRDDEASQRIGSYMLKGWTLTNDTCPTPDCLVPLLRLKKTLVCSACDIDPKLPPASRNISCESDSMEELLNSEDEGLERRDVVPKLLGEKLMQGWMMLDECCLFCGDVPLMKSRKDELLCVGCNSNQKPEQVQVIEPQSEEVVTMSTAHGNLISEDRNAVPKMLGQKLLEGWTMLESTCFACPDVPLMRSRAGSLLCVKCESNQSVAEKVEEMKRPLAQEISHPNINDEPHFETEGRVENSSRQLSNADRRIVENAYLVLIQKLAVLTDQLKATVGSSETSLVCQAIKECASSIAAIKSL